MTWLIFSLFGAFFWALVHHIDKLLLTKFAVNYGVGALVIFSSLFPALLLPIVIFVPNIDPLTLPFNTILGLFFSGLLGAVAALCYFYALEEEETTIVVSMYQLSPVFGYVLGVILLDEILAGMQIVGALITILGVTVLSFEFLEEHGVVMKKKMTLLMIAAAFIFALGDVVYKSAAIDNVPYLSSIFWLFAGYVVFGIAALLCVKEYRRNFFSILQNRHHAVLGINLVNESLQTAALMCTAYALLLAPVALVLVMDSYQPILVFIIGIFLTFFAPHLAQEKLTPWHFLHKTVAIVIAVIGTILMQST
jgi:uncharacterized membrane protein